jgi:hypothetical protein
MFSKKQIINIFSLSVLALIGALFVYKYSARKFNNSTFLSLIFILFYLSVILLISKIRPDKFSFLNKKVFIYFISVTSLFLLISIHFIPESSNVGRFPAINEWLTNLVNGRFPYNTVSKPSGFPVLFFLAFPFYLIGEPGYLELCGYLIFCICLYNYRKSKKILFIRLAMLFLMPAFFYEFLVRSELLFNMSLVVSLILLTEKYLQRDKVDLKFIMLAVYFGLLLSTRIIIGSAFVIYLFYYFRQNLKNLFLYSVITILMFTLTVLPFIFWNSRSFFETGPFYIQFLHISLWLVAPVLFIILFISWVVSNKRELFFAFGLMFFIIITFALINFIYEFGIQYAIFGKYCFDISYYIFRIPFLILSIEDTASMKDKLLYEK